MDENKLIGKIRELRQIKPRQDWVLLTKSQILKEEIPQPRELRKVVSFIREIQRGERFTLHLFKKGEGFIFQHKPAFAFALTLAVLFGLFGFSQNSLPGDTLFPIKKIAENSQAIFVSENDQLKYEIELVNKRLDDLTKVAESNLAKNLAPAINEVQASVLKVAQNLKETKPDAVKEIIRNVKGIEQKSAEMRVLGIELGDNIELDSALVKLIKAQVDDLEERSLTLEQSEILDEIKADIKEGKYADALEKLLTEL